MKSVITHPKSTIVSTADDNIDGVFKKLAKPWL